MRAIRKRYFARSEPDSAAHGLNASRAAATAASTSSGPAWATSASGSSSAGEIVVNHSPDRGSTHSPPTNRPYRSRSVTTLRDSGAGAYVHSEGIGARPPSRLSRSVIGEVIAGLVGAGALLADLHQHVIEEGRRPDAVEVGRQPVGAERLVHLHEVL